MKKIFSFLVCLFVCSCFVFAGDEVIRSYFYPNLGQIGNSSPVSDDDFPVVLDPAYPVVIDPNFPDTLTPDFPDTEEPEFPEAEVKPVKDVLKEQAEKAMKEEKENFKVALEKLMKQNLFDFDSDVIKEENFDNLDSIAEFLKEYDNIEVEIEGHTDNVGSEEYNKSLSERRAKSVGDYLINKGVDSSRITTEGFGFSKPAASNDTEEGQAQNRRTEMIFKLKDISAAIASENQTIQEKAAQEVLEEKAAKEEVSNVQETVKEEIETKEKEVSDAQQAVKEEIETREKEIADAKQTIREEAKDKEEEISSDLQQALSKETEAVKEEESNVQETVKEEVETKEEELSDLEKALRKNAEAEKEEISDAVKEEAETAKEELSNAQETVKEEVETKEEELSDLEKALRKNAEAEKEEISDVVKEEVETVKEEIETKKEELSSDLQQALSKETEAVKEEESNVQETVKEEVETKEEELSDIERALRKNAEKEESSDIQQALRQEVKNAIEENKGDFSIALEKFSKESLFEFGSATIMEENFASLDAIAELLKENDKIAIKVEGHTDNIGSEEYNKGLSERRAKAVGNYLVSKGVNSSRITTEGFGSSKPIASNDTEEGQAQNRRTEIIFKIQK